MAPAPPVTIGLPVYNGERYISQAIESILAQGFGDFHLLISDNSSTDSTWDICCSYASLDSRIKLYRNSSNVGALENFNKIFRVSTSPFFMWMSHDDVIDSTYLQKCFSFLQEHPDFVLCTARNGRVTLGGLLINESRHPSFVMDSSDLVVRFRQCLRNKRMPMAIYGLIRKKALEETNLLRPVVGADFVLLAELSLIGKFQELQEVLRYYRERSAGPPSQTWRSSVDTLFGIAADDSFPFWLRMYFDFVGIMARKSVSRDVKRRILASTVVRVFPYTLYYEIVWFGQRATHRWPSVYHLLARVHRRILKIKMSQKES